jgi:hypothetical protein
MTCTKYASEPLLGAKRGRGWKRFDTPSSPFANNAAKAASSG